MKILYLTQYFFTPEQAGGSRHYYHVRHLIQSGHQVDVLTSYVQDHMSRQIPEKYRRRFLVREETAGVTVYKTYASANYGKKFMDRMKNYLSFMFFAIFAGLRIGGSYEMVFASSPSLFVGAAGFILAKCKRALFALEVRDLWPKSAIELGMLNNRWLIALSRWLEKFLYRKAAVVIALTRGIQKAVRENVADRNKVKLVTNGVDSELFQYPPRIDYRKKMRLKNRFLAVYVGSHGINNDLETMIDAAEQLRGIPEILFLFVGGGDHKARLMEICREKGLCNVCFVAPMPKQAAADVLKCADVTLLAIKKGNFFDGTLPNKLFDYLASGRPMVAAVPLQGESARMIRQLNSGIICHPEDGKGMAEGIRMLYQDRKLLRESSREAKAFVLGEYSRTRLAADLESILVNTVEKVKYV